MKTDTFTESILYKHPRDRSRSSGTCTRVRKLHEDQGHLSRKQLVKRLCHCLLLPCVGERPNANAAGWLVSSHAALIHGINRRK